MMQHVGECHCGVAVERENSSVESILSLAELCRFTTDFKYRRKKKRCGRQSRN